MKSLTVCNQIVLLILLFALSFEPVDMTSGTRRKRVMYGLPTEAKDRDEYYPHFRYYVFLGKGPIDEDPNWFKRWFKIGLTPKAENQVCGGSLLTPSVVQTACHCLSTYKVREGNFTNAWTLNVWEDRIYSYVGSNIIDGLSYLLIPKHYIIYEACRQVTATKTNIFDFAVIVNKDTTYQKAGGAKISYAPVYRSKDMQDFYYTATEKEYTCLFIGFGKYTTKGPPVYGRIQIDPANSEVLRWGWRSLRNYEDCMSMTCDPSVQKMGYYNYRRRVSWACFSSTTKGGYHHAAMPGDSGGPVSCNNVYFAIQSFGTLLDNLVLETMAGPIAYTGFENSVETRNKFVKFCDEFGDSHPDVPATVYLNPNRPTPPPRRSQSPQIIFHRLIILSSTLFTWFIHHF